MELHHLVDCIVFPQKGHRPHTNECSGSDLDGDIYFATWDRTLIPPTQADPMDYVTPAPEYKDSVSMANISDFFVNYMRNDNLGQIANAHLAHSDVSTEGAWDSKCIRLAELHSVAVDYPKTGVPATVPRDLVPSSYPDFMMKRDKATHESTTILGRLYRQVRNHKPEGFKRLTSSPYDLFDPDLDVEGHEAFLENAEQRKREYDFQLRSILNRYGIRHECQAVGGYLVSLPRIHRRRSLFDVQQQVRNEAAELRRHFKDVFQEDSTGDDNVSKQQRASAWYVVTYHPQYVGQGSLMSFPWVMHDLLCIIKSRAMNRQNRELNPGRMV